MTINIEIAESPDCAALAAIHCACFEKGWDADAMRELLSVAGTKAFVAGAQGFGLLRVVAGEAEILTLAVADRYRRQGVAKAMVAMMLTHARKHGVESLFLEVRQSNVAAQALYRKAGFAVLSVRKGYYQGHNGTSEDAVVMQYR